MTAARKALKLISCKFLAFLSMYMIISHPLRKHFPDIFLQEHDMYIRHQVLRKKSHKTQQLNTASVYCITQFLSQGMAHT